MAGPDTLVLELLRAIRAEAAETRAELKADIASLRTELKSDIRDVRGEVHSLRADTASDMLLLRKEMSEQIVGLRRAVVDYHSSVIGHGIIISDLEARVRRLETHLHLGEPN